MKLIKFKLILLSLIFVLQINLSRQNIAVPISKDNFNETIATIRKNILTLNQNQGELKTLYQDKQHILEDLRHVLHPVILSSPNNECPIVDNRLIRLEQNIQQKIDGNYQQRSQKLEDISELYLNCSNAKTQKSIDIAEQLKKQLARLETLIESLKDIRQKAENRKSVKQPANAQLTLMLKEMNEKLVAQELKLQELESQIPLIEKAAQYVKLRNKNRKCKKCFQLDIMNKLPFE